MSTAQTIQELAKIAALADTDDVQRLVALRDGLHQFASDSDSNIGERCISVANRTAELVEQIVLRELEDTAQALAQIHEALDYLQLRTEAMSQGTDACDDLALPSIIRDGASDPARADTNEAADSELLDSWIASSTEAVDTIASLVARLGTDDATDRDIPEIRRHIHTIKGEAGIVGASEAQELFNEAESAIDRVIKQAGEFPTDALNNLANWLRSYLGDLTESRGATPPDNASLLSQFRSICSDSVERPQSPRPKAQTQPAANTPAKSEPPAPESDEDGPVTIEQPADDDMVAEFLVEAREHLDAAEAAVLELENNPGDLELINTIFRAFHTIKGVAGFMNFKPIVETAHSAEYLLDAARSGDVTLTPTNLDLILRAADMLASLIGAVEGGTPPMRSTMRSLIDMLERARKGEEVQLGGARGAKPAQGVKAPSPGAAQPDSIAEDAEADSDLMQEPQRAQQSARRPDQTIKVNTGRLDSLVDMVGELVIAQQMIVQDPSVQSIAEQKTQRNLVHVGKIIRDLQEVAMSLRMVTIRGAFQKMQRLVRDVSLKAGKNINFYMEGEDTELDRNVVDVIGDPLVHMVRNACDHGIESAADRVAAGKAESGNLTLRAFHKGGSIVIEIEDDGKGLDREKILKKAIERGVYTPDRDLSEIPDSEVFRLIFAPGFSTADKVTDISGRGVGMDVVRRNIESLRGEIEIRSTKGQGTTFMMRLPLTMAIIDGMVVRVGSQRYVVPTLAIEQSFRPTPDQISTIAQRGEMAMVRGSLLPVYRLNSLFGIREGMNEFKDTLLIVLEASNMRCCLMVDEILGQQQVVIKSLGSGISQIRGVSGGAILGDGRVALILDVAGVFAEAMGEQHTNRPQRVENTETVR
ncbi:MAG: chemotaxis protein CheA [Phycisphaeraceae bacterium]|nr:chemotaxis protein CheA [Phycisphaerales bacterium]MCB9841638.1 chemotaxis protein CheA [Phycisphaeraceae bacterium]